MVTGREDGTKSKLDQSQEMGGFTCQEVWTVEVFVFLFVLTYVFVIVKRIWLLSTKS